MRGGRVVSSEICDEIVRRVFAWKHKPSNCCAFARDLLVVVCGVRPVVFCDEVRFHREGWTEVGAFLKGVAALSGVTLSGLEYKDTSQWDVKGGHGGVLYLLHRDLLEETCLAREGGKWPIFLVSKPSCSDVRIVVDSKPAVDYIVSMVDGILSTLESKSNDGGILDLSRIPGASESLPTLNGWLLEYPVIYAHGIEGLNLELGRVVGSMEDKAVVRCCLECKLVGMGQHRMAVCKVPQICSFTVPEGVLDDGEFCELLAMIKSQLNHRIGGMEGVWGQLEVVREASGCVVWAT